MEGRHKLAFFQRNSVDLIGRGTHTKVGIDRVENHISGVMGNSCSVMGAILRVKLNAAIGLSHSYFAIVISEDIELDYLTVESSQALQTQLGSVKYFYLWTINA